METTKNMECYRYHRNSSIQVKSQIPKDKLYIPNKGVLNYDKNNPKKRVYF